MASLSGSPLHPSANDPYTHEAIQSFLRYMQDNSCQGVTFGADSSYQPRRFYPDRVLKWYFDCSQQDDARRVRELVAAAAARSYSRPDFRAVANDCPKVFTILALIGQSHHINHFVQHARLQDNNLPFHPEDEVWFPVINNNMTFFKSFCERQWEFCVTPLRKRLGDVTIEDDRILPILPLERVDKSRGWSASVYKIQVDEDYDLLGGDQGPQSEPHVYAIKSYYPSAARHVDPVNERSPHGLPRPKNYYDAEVDAFRRLNESGEPIPNLVGFYGAFTQSQSHHIILQYANIGTLEDYWEKVDPPRGGADILTLWSKLFEINRALVQMHESESDGDTGSPRIFQGWHEDIKPSNILVLGDAEGSPYGVHFMLADLGLSHFSATVEGKNSATRDGRGGSQAYSAPERNQATNFKPKVTQNIDTWSLGCVYSEFNAWIVGGVRSGVQRYRQARKNHKDVDKALGACFHDKQGEVLSAVEEWHTNSLSLCATHDHVTPIIWKELLRGMFYPTKFRFNSQQVDRCSQEVLKAAHDRLVRSPTREDSGLEAGEHSASRPHTPPQLPPEFYQHQRTQNGVSSYPLTPPDERRVQQYGSQDFDYIGRSTGNADHPTPTRSPPDSRESAVPFPDIYHNSYNSARTRVVSTSTDEMTHSMFSNNTQRFSAHEQPFSKSGDIAIRPKPPEMIYSELLRRSTMPAEGTPVSPRLLEPNGQAQPTDAVESSELPADVTAKGKERLVDERQPREPPRSQPDRFLSVEELKQWDLQMRTRKTSKSRSLFSRELEIPLPFEAELLVELRKRDHVFVIDDGRSMHPHWEELINLYSPLIYMVKKKKLDPNGSELRFIMSDESKEAENTSPLVSMVRERGYHLSGQSNLAHRLEYIFVQYRKKLQRSPSTTRPISLYIFTDGKWQPGNHQLAEVGSAIKRLVDFLEVNGFQQRMAGIQFIQFGNDPVGTERLQWLDEVLPSDRGLARDICDTTPANGNVWKMLLGSINSYWDGD
ncbi:hypothetical protein H2200_012376 [Cladophialophora chaetospira]|uniref:Protein kinase domain-containing protein n=1 Tax=Cladophialophora chaetospira TaxID=386627 RepID=A0AA39CCE0_9EURO|nr:hypothetical protein H2200_012376 [Cladophialophora chaetospira]